jgi:hypothetical protein
MRILLYVVGVLMALNMVVAKECQVRALPAIVRSVVWAVISERCLAFLQGQDLPADGKLRIGVKSRPEACTKKTKKGDKLSMHYTGGAVPDASEPSQCGLRLIGHMLQHVMLSGKLYKDCSKFDSSVDRNQPFTFTLGQGQVSTTLRRG